jgi:hypothetical protein
LFDQIIIGDKASYDDFEASVAERKNNKPKKKSIKETVPFSNETHDFSAINGEIYWEERTLEYVFEISANSPEELEEKKQPFISWVMNVMNEELHDPFVRDYHFLATFSELSDDDSEIEKSTITVKFTAYPYMISNMKRIIPCNITATEQVVNIKNNSSHRVTPTFICDVEYTVVKGNTSYTIPAGELASAVFMLAPGTNTIKVRSTRGSGTLKIEFHEEVF